MVKQHAHAMLANDRLGLLHRSGAFQSQRCTKSISSTSQRSWGAVRTLSPCTRMHTCINKHSDVLKRSCATEKVSAYIGFFPWWLMDVDWNTQSLRFFCLQHLSSNSSSKISLIPLSGGINFQLGITFCSSCIRSSPYIYCMSCLIFRALIYFEFKPVQSPNADILIVLFMDKSQHELAHTFCISYWEICLHILRTKSKPLPHS